MAYYLVTGGAGFIGSHVVELLLAEGHRVRVLDDLSTGKRENVFPGAELLIGSITDPAAVTQACEGIDGCFHLAAVASVMKCQEEWAASHEVNLTGAVRILETALKRPGGKEGKGFPLVYTSSAAIYGDQKQQPIQEDATPTPLGPYGADKLGCELHANAARHVYGQRCMGVRPFNVYGPRQDPSSPYSGVISIFADRLGKGQGITIFGDGNQTRDFIFVKDVARCFYNAMRLLETTPLKETPPVVNLCTGKATTINRLAQVIAEVAGVTPAITHGPARAGEIYASTGDNTLVKRVLGLEAPVSLTEGLTETLGLSKAQKRHSA